MRNKGYQRLLGEKRSCKTSKHIFLEISGGADLDSYNPSLAGDFLSSVLSPTRLTSWVTALSICASGKGLVQRAIYKDQNPDLQNPGLLKPSAMPFQWMLVKYLSNRVWDLQGSSAYKETPALWSENSSIWVSFLLVSADTQETPTHPRFCNGKALRKVLLWTKFPGVCSKEQ